MTLGVMALSESSSPSEASSTNEAPPKKTVAEALDLLNSLRPEIMDIVSDTGGISVPLTGLRIMNAKPEEAHVLWAGPGSQRDGSSLWKISLLVFDRFKAAGFVTDTRPLKLHCTLLNSTFRKPRQAFSSTEILKRVATQPAIAGIPTPTTTTAALAVEDVANRADFGVYAVDEIHLWKMGSWDEEKRYVSSGHISLK
ncbi:hypothetical protein FRB90_011953 [Tulasnella sp. 427]|nr:hypothetical protein FRB90_011953 [Tulasnella sp. 427]